MPVYAQKVATTNPRWHGRQIAIRPDTVVLCGGCNKNQSPEGYVWLVYLDKRSLRYNQPYDCFCQKCLDQYFPKRVEVPLDNPV